MNWLTDQLMEFNLFEIVLTVIFTVYFQNYKQQQQIEALNHDMYSFKEEIKDEMRGLRK